MSKKVCNGGVGGICDKKVIDGFYCKIHLSYIIRKREITRDYSDATKKLRRFAFKGVLAEYLKKRRHTYRSARRMYKRVFGKAPSMAELLEKLV